MTNYELWKKSATGSEPDFIGYKRGTHFIEAVANHFGVQELDRDESGKIKTEGGKFPLVKGEVIYSSKEEAAGVEQSGSELVTETAGEGDNHSGSGANTGNASGIPVTEGTGSGNTGTGTKGTGDDLSGNAGTGIVGTATTGTDGLGTNQPESEGTEGTTVELGPKGSEALANGDQVTIKQENQRSAYDGPKMNPGMMDEYPLVSEGKELPGRTLDYREEDSFRDGANGTDDKVLSTGAGQEKSVDGNDGSQNHEGNTGVLSSTSDDQSEKTLPLAESNSEKQ